ncbi:hypothetical protein [Belliella pelovolcani]|jgi:hypothetical protein|uniref:hypothetical protein n=1 Tax=Belliella pelovolcani TaxID=529505 RepID=UPI00391A9109
MFEGSDYPKSLDEDLFDSWFEKGRASLMPYTYMLIIWDELENEYFPVYVEQRSEIQSYEKYGSTPERQSLIAAYDLYSESRMG